MIIQTIVGLAAVAFIMGLIFLCARFSDFFDMIAALFGILITVVVGLFLCRGLGFLILEVVHNIK